MISKKSVVKFAKELKPLDLKDLAEQLEKVETQESEAKETEQEAIKTAQAEADEKIAQAFIDHFSHYLRTALVKQIYYEAKAESPDGDPYGGLRHYLRCQRGWLPVRKLDQKFVGRSHETNFEPPAWVEIAIKKLAKLGWKCEVRKQVYSDLGGNDVAVYLSVKDPRPAKTLSPA